MTELHSRAIEDVDDIRRFLFAGRAVLTLTSMRTNTRYTYKVQAPPEHQGNFKGFYVNLLTGPNNMDDYTYLGIIPKERDGLTATKRSRHYGSSPFKAFAYFVDRVIVRGTSPKLVQLEVRHEGRCCRCGRALTVPESIDRGIGPECWSAMSGGG